MCVYHMLHFQVVLSSQDKADLRSILLVSQTNSACDDFLSELPKKGITKCGSGVDVRMILTVDHKAWK